MTESIGKAKLWMFDCGQPGKVSNTDLKISICLAPYKNNTLKISHFYN